MEGADLTSMDWDVIGGKSGAGFRDVRHEWASGLMQCRRQKAPALFKQWGGMSPNPAGGGSTERRTTSIPKSKGAHQEQSGKAGRTGRVRQRQAQELIGPASASHKWPSQNGAFWHVQLRLHENPLCPFSTQTTLAPPLRGLRALPWETPGRSFPPRLPKTYSA